jgi:AmiR/NasT family two-component response regulator
MMDYEVVKSYGARIYSRINVACPDCNVILLFGQDHRDVIKEAVEHGVYACILPPYEEWEVLTIIRNIIAKKKMIRKQEINKDQVL